MKGTILVHDIVLQQQCIWPIHDIVYHRQSSVVWVTCRHTNKVHVFVWLSAVAKSYLVHVLLSSGTSKLRQALFFYDTPRQGS